MSEGKMSDGITRLLVSDSELLNPDQSELVRWLDSGVDEEKRSIYRR